MSRTRIVKGKIYEFVEEHLTYYSEKGIVESSAINYTENSQTNIIIGANPENAPSADLVSYYIRVRIKDPANYNGKFGFDWIDIDPVSEEIKKIQDVDFSNVEYFYKKGVPANDLGNIVAKSSDEPGAKTAIKENYKFPDSLKPCTDGKVDRPFVLIKPGQEISLSLEVNIPAGGTLTDEKIYLTNDDFYSFEMVGGTKDAATKRTEIKISSDKQIVELKIKCLKESPSEKKYTILQDNPTSGKTGLPVGGFFMMENKVLKLKFRVIALVSSDGAPATKAQALFQKFKGNKIKEYLNENSLNQAGYEVEIENQTMFDTLGSGNLDDYFYAFDKMDWTTKKYFANINKQKPDVDPTTGYCKTASWDPVKNECAKIPVPTDVIVDNQKDLGLPDKANEIDGIAITEYKNKLKTKGKSYEGGIIILSDFESSDEGTGAYSRTSPLNHYALIVYSTNTENTGTYAHEIGHMLGLDHLFFETKELNSFSNSKNYYQTLKTNLITKTGETYPFYIYKLTRSKISTLKEALNNFITNRRNYIAEKERDIVKGKAANGSFTYGGKSVTKTQFLALIQEDIDKQKKYITENKKALEDTSGIKDYDHFEADFNILKNDSIKLDKEFINFYESEWQQIVANFLRFKKASTKNIMDYDNTRVVYLSHQIRIMRNDIKNY